MGQTRKLHWTACLWPGLPLLWNQGSWVGLAVAVGFTALANVLLLASLVFTEWLTSNVRLTGLGVLTVVWLLAWWQSRGERVRGRVGVAEEESPEGEQPADEREEWFREAQQRYLENDWVATEQLLLKLLKQDARDVESRLMLATLWRHQGRGEEALRQLDRLERLEAASTWKYEIEAEREAIVSAVRKDELTPENLDKTNDKKTNDKKPLSDDTSRPMAA
ncbi:MAG: hypothetical protein GXP28_09500 [Planctomycetes bacterium]|nr:hypothetical protein [Planctomycetota bacterium]